MFDALLQEEICQWMHLHRRFEQPPLIMISASILWTLRQMCLCCMPRGINSNSNLKLSILLSLLRQSPTTINIQIYEPTAPSDHPIRAKKHDLSELFMLSDFLILSNFSFPAKSCQNEFLFLC